MELFEAINQRKTNRDFENGVISKEILEKIISAGPKAPTNDHKKASLAVQKANYAVKMYEKVGFEVVDENDEEFIMVCNL